MTTHRLQGLYAITDSQLLPGERLLQGVEAALRGGASLIQYRDKQSSSIERLRNAENLLACCRAWQRPLIINDDVDLARRIGADGIHLGQTDDSLAAARQILGEHCLIGATCHASLELARQAEQAGADYLAFGRFFISSTKAEAPPAKMDILSRVRMESALPLVAIGGITLDNAPQLLKHPIQMLAVVYSLFALPSMTDIEERATDFCRLFA